MWHSQCFKIQVLKTEDNPFNILKATPVLCINGCENFTSYFKLYPPHHEADPFLFVHNDRLFLFYESKPFYKKGVIKMTSTVDLEHWTKPITVLKEPFHLSFPWVFMDKGEVYMIPETCADKSIRLYKATNSELTSFTLQKTLLRQSPKEGTIFSYSDSSVVVADKMYYLFTSTYKGDPKSWKGTYYMDLYVSDKLDGEYKIHPCSPICISNKYGRNGGCLFVYGEKIYRVAQDCSGIYGGDINILEVKRLSPNIYEEALFKENLLYKKTSFYNGGGHQYNFIRFKSKTVIATDATETKMFLFAKLMKPIRRIKSFLYSTFKK